jgi:outer membrane lipoprotein LolB
VNPVNRLAALLAAAALLGACATPPLPADGGPVTSGRLSLRVDAAAERPAQGVTAAFELQGDAERGELRLLSPLGGMLAAARWAPGQALLDTPAGRQGFVSLDELSLQALGEVLPLAALPDWLAGRPWPGAAHLTLPDGFEQLGWRVDLARRAEGWVLAQRAAPPAVVLRVRLDGPGV